jgi:D-glycerate 3-kinase
VEGWCMGFSSISNSTLTTRWQEMTSDEMKMWCSMDHVREVNMLLDAYEGFLIHLFRSFLTPPFLVLTEGPHQIKPPNPPPNVSPYAIIYKWRLEQEHYMKAHNGGMGMSDAQVVSYVQAAYMCYAEF